MAVSIGATQARTGPRRGTSRPSGSVLRLALALPPVIYLLLLFLAPLSIMLVYSLLTRSGLFVEPPWTLENYRRFFDTAVYGRLLLKTFRISVEMVALCVIIGFPVAYIIARVVPPRWRLFMLALIIIPSWTSFIVRTYAFIIILNEQGPINETLTGLGITDQPLTLLYNETAVLIGLLNVYVPWVVLPIYASLSKIDDSLYEAAQDLGAGRLQLWRRVVIPLSMPGLIAGVFLSFIPALGTYATPLILGGRTATLYPNAITSQFGANNWPFGAALAMILLLIVFGLLALYNRVGRVERIWTS